MSKSRNVDATNFLIAFLIPVIIAAASPLAATTSSDTDYFKSVRKKLIDDGFNAEKIQQLYSRPQVSFEADGVTIFFTYSEARLDYDQFTNDWSIRKAKKFMDQYQVELDQVQQKYGVDSRIITAILLVETGLGTTVGTRSALNTLSTLASLSNRKVRSEFWKIVTDKQKISRKKFEKRADQKSKWAYRELKAFLTYAYREGLDPTEVQGSIAGAIGYAQFMPSNIIAYGKDGDNDGRVDLLTHADAMASIANFLRSHGWRPGISRKKAEKVIYYYNHSTYYVDTILKIANRLES
jgi:membrane-bound lytic murein transglycosylase B